MDSKCTKKGCTNEAQDGSTLCAPCSMRVNINEEVTTNAMEANTPMSVKYSKYYKPVPKNITELDVYAVCKMFPVQDDTGCINHARKKLLIPGTRTGGKTFYDDIKEARDTLTRWLELNPPLVPLGSPESFKQGQVEGGVAKIPIQPKTFELTGDMWFDGKLVPGTQ